jgi:phosphate starvation-inducible protein PhoH and related proteins
LPTTPKLLTPIEFLTDNQKLYYDIMGEYRTNIVMCHGLAGTGKTYVSMYKALEDVLRRGNHYKKICIINPTVDVGKEDSLGYLPGTLMDKIELYNDSAFFILNKLIGKDYSRKFIDEHKIEFRVINHLRGVNLEDMYVILDEAQNVSPLQMKTLITRICDTTKLIIQGDLTQCDKYKEDYRKSGFWDAWVRLRDVDGIEFMQFDKEDVVRSGIVRRVLETYNYNGDSIELPD